VTLGAGELERARTTMAAIVAELEA
jgi:hypothetical protein